MSKPKLERNPTLQEWQLVYLEQEAAFLIWKYKKVFGNKNKVKSTGKNLEI